MEVVIYPLWCVVGPLFINQRDPPWVSWFFCGQEAKKGAPMCLFWTVWKERNRIAFENEEFLIRRMKYSFVCNFWSWTKLKGGLFLSSTFFDWLGFR